MYSTRTSRIAVSNFQLRAPMCERRNWRTSLNPPLSVDGNSFRNSFLLYPDDEFFLFLIVCLTQFLWRCDVLIPSISSFAPNRNKYYRCMDRSSSQYLGKRSNRISVPLLVHSPTKYRPRGALVCTRTTSETCVRKPPIGSCFLSPLFTSRFLISLLFMVQHFINVPRINDCRWYLVFGIGIYGGSRNLSSPYVE